MWVMCGNVGKMGNVGNVGNGYHRRTGCIDVDVGPCCRCWPMSFHVADITVVCRRWWWWWWCWTWWCLRALMWWSLLLPKIYDGFRYTHSHTHTHSNTLILFYVRSYLNYLNCLLSLHATIIRIIHLFFKHMPVRAHRYNRLIIIYIFKCLRCTMVEWVVVVHLLCCTMLKLYYSIML